MYYQNYFIIVRAGFTSTFKKKIIILAKNKKNRQNVLLIR